MDLPYSSCNIYTDSIQLSACLNEQENCPQLVKNKSNNGCGSISSPWYKNPEIFVTLACLLISASDKKTLKFSICGKLKDQNMSSASSAQMIDIYHLERGLTGCFSLKYNGTCFFFPGSMFYLSKYKLGNEKLKNVFAE